MLTPSIKSVQRSRLKTQYCQMYFQGETGSLLRTLVHTNGLSPDPQKVQAISNMPVPSNKTEL